MLDLEDKSISMACRSDVRRLHAEFHQEFDASLICNYLNLLHKNRQPSDDRILGEGKDARAHVLPGNTLVATLPKPEVWDDIREARWSSRLRIVQAIGPFVLVPPLVPVSYEGGRALISPYGNADVDQISSAWRPIDGWIELFSKKLAESNLFIDDVIQIRSRNGTPFVVDFSDLDTIHEG